jgi:hypothetical protein
MTLREIQARIVAILQGTAALADLTILAEDRKDLITAISSSLAKLGLCAIVQTISAKVTKPNLPGPVYGELRFSVVVYENVMINRSKFDRTAQDVAELISEALHQQRIGEDGTGKQLLSEGVLPQDGSEYNVFAVDLTLN